MREGFCFARGYIKKDYKELVKEQTTKHTWPPPPWPPASMYHTTIYCTCRTKSPFVIAKKNPRF